MKTNILAKLVYFGMCILEVIGGCAMFVFLTSVLLIIFSE